MLTDLHPTDFSQGTIFSCCKASEYSDCPVFGLAITARCDAAHSKVPIYNYLPIVKLDDWIRRHGSEIVAERVIAGSRGSLASCLKEQQTDPGILNHVPHSDILDQLRSVGTKAGKARAARFAKAMTEIEAAETLFEQPNQDIQEQLLRDNEKLIRSIIAELTRNQFIDYHYLPRIETRQNPTGFVVNLREVRHISAATAELVLKGIDPKDYSANSAIGRALREDLDFQQPESDYAMAIAQVGSPVIELILQRFSALFARVGVDDLTVDEVRGSSETLSNILEPS